MKQKCFFLDEIKQGDIINKNNKRHCMVLNYIEQSLILV